MAAPTDHDMTIRPHYYIGKILKTQKFMWTWENATFFMMDQPIGYSLKSENFPSNGSEFKWQLEIFPCGGTTYEYVNGKYEYNVEFQLHLISQLTTKIQTKCQIEIKYGENAEWEKVTGERTLGTKEYLTIVWSKVQKFKDDLNAFGDFVIFKVTVTYAVDDKKKYIA